MTSPPSYERRVHVRDRAADPRRDRLAYRREVPPDDAVHQPGGGESPDLVGDQARRTRAIDDSEPELAREDPSVTVHLLDGEARAQLTRRAEHPGRSVQGDHERDVDGVSGPVLIVAKEMAPFVPGR